MLFCIVLYLHLCMYVCSYVKIAGDYLIQACLYEVLPRLACMRCSPSYRLTCLSKDTDSTKVLSVSFDKIDCKNNYYILKR